jgi:predicted lipid carrier protein YhbT
MLLERVSGGAIHMAGPTSTFFDELREQGRLPTLARASGTIGFEIVEDGDVQRWVVAINAGNIQVSRQATAADCVVRVDAGLFDEIVSGRRSAVAAYLRGALSLEGDPELLVLAQRLFAGVSDGCRS